MHTRALEREIQLFLQLENIKFMLTTGLRRENGSENPLITNRTTGNCGGNFMTNSCSCVLQWGSRRFGMWRCWPWREFCLPMGTLQPRIRQGCGELTIPTHAIPLCPIIRYYIRYLKNSHPIQANTFCYGSGRNNGKVERNQMLISLQDFIKHV